MFIKVTSSGPRRYVQLVEAFRDASGAPKQRTVATLGRLDQLSAGLESFISGLLRVTGRSLPAAAQHAVEFESAASWCIRTERKSCSVIARMACWHLPAV